MADIIGLSCRFPESNGPAEFWANLMDGTDMVTCDDRRWPVGFQGLPPRSGKLPGFDKFDASFFSVHGKQAQVNSLLQSHSVAPAPIAALARGPCDRVQLSRPLSCLSTWFKHTTILDVLLLAVLHLASPPLTVTNTCDA